MTGCDELGIAHEQLPDFVQTFHEDQRAASAKDMHDHPELAAKLQDARLLGGDMHTGSDLLQYILNTKEERRVIDLICESLKHKGVEICSYEHDGLFLRTQLGSTEVKRVAEAASDYPVTVKRCAGYDLQTLTAELIAKAEVESPMQVWQSVDDAWGENESLVREARRAKLMSHDTFATLLMAEKQVSNAIPWPLKGLFKLPRLAHNYLWYDAQHAVWVEGGANGVSRLKDYITLMLENRLSEYTLGEHLDASVTTRRDFGNKQFRDGVESCLRSKLVVDEHFHLDPTCSYGI